MPPCLLCAAACLVWFLVDSRCPAADHTLHGLALSRGHRCLTSVLVTRPLLLPHALPSMASLLVVLVGWYSCVSTTWSLSSYRPGTYTKPACCSGLLLLSTICMQRYFLLLTMLSVASDLLSSACCSGLVAVLERYFGVECFLIWPACCSAVPFLGLFYLQFESCYLFCSMLHTTKSSAASTSKFSLLLYPSMPSSPQIFIDQSFF